MTILIENRRIIEFCEQYPCFDIEKTVLSFIELIENTSSNAVPSLNSTLASQIVDSLKSLQNQVYGLENNLSIKHNEYINKSAEIKKEYVEDIRTILSINNTDKLLPTIKEHNENFVNKLSLMFKELIPKEQQIQTQYLQNVLKNIEQTVVIEMNKGITQSGIDNLLNNIEQKFATILTHSEQKINTVLSAVSENKKEEEQIHNKLDEMLNKLGRNNEKGKISENLLNFNLQAIYPTAEILNVSNTPHSGDFWILRKDKPSILVENKNHDDKVYSDDVQKFIDDINTNNMCGIFISQKSKIVYRDNYEIEIHNGNVAVYIHECNYDPYKIKIAVQIIDTLKLKIEKQKIENGTTFTVDIEVLNRINKEYQLFNIKKTQHIAEIKTMCETLLKSAFDMELEALDDFLESNGLLANVKKFVCGNCAKPFKTQTGLHNHERVCEGPNEKRKGVNCDHCTEFFPTRKGLRTHCIKKHNIDIDKELTDH